MRNLIYFFAYVLFALQQSNIALAFDITNTGMTPDSNMMKSLTGDIVCSGTQLTGIERVDGSTPTITTSTVAQYKTDGIGNITYGFVRTSNVYYGTNYSCSYSLDANSVNKYIVRWDGTGLMKATFNLYWGSQFYCGDTAVAQNSLVLFTTGFGKKTKLKKLSYISISDNDAPIGSASGTCEPRLQ